MSLIFHLAIALMFVSTAYQQKCYQVYLCCEKNERECLEYCGPYTECEEEDNELTETTEDSNVENNLQTTTDQTNLESTTREGETGANPHQVLTGQMCRKGFTLVNKKCRRIM